MAQADAPMGATQRILRHNNLMTTKRYIGGLDPAKPAIEVLSYRNSRPTSRPGAKTEVVDLKEVN